MTHKAALLALLSDGRPHHMREAQAHGGWRYGARILELRREGHVIETRQLARGEFQYQLVVSAKQGVLV